MKLRGIFLIILAVAIPLIWHIPLAGQRNTAAIISQYLGVSSLILMGIAQLQATRIPGIEAVFGSMDRVYVQHKWLAVIAVVLAYIHGEVIDADAGGIDGRWSDLAENVGELAMNGFIFLTIASLVTIIPYKFWKWSHRLIGLVFAMAAFHFIYIEKPYAVMEPIGLYTMLFCAIGVLSYLYLLLPRMIGFNTKQYEVTSVVERNNIAEIKIKPKNKGIKHKAGQFTFINFKPVSLRETHPFTISSAPNEKGELTFLVKGLGSYTKRLNKTLEPGTTAWVSKPFGHFNCHDTGNPQAWIGAGIGITPFLAWADTLDNSWSSKTTLYYCVPSRAEAWHVDKLQEIADRVDNFEFKLIVSKVDKRLSAEQIAEELVGDIKTADAYFCGPTKMRESLRAGLVKRGLRSGNFHFEEFEMRAGLGFMKLGQRLLATVTPAKDTHQQKGSQLAKG